MRVLFTRDLDEKDRQLASQLGLRSFSVPLVSIRYPDKNQITDQNPRLFDQIARAQAIAFTSKHAVHALFDNIVTQEDHDFVTKLIALLRPKPVYTVGESTADVLDLHGIMARFPDDYNGSTLASMMLNDGVNSTALHFCGSLRRPEFGSAMSEAGIELTEIEVYSKSEADFTEVFIRQWNSGQLTGSGLPDSDWPGTLELAGSENHGTSDIGQIFLEQMQVAAFYSPSAVQAFFTQGLNNHFSGTYTAIGHTTASALGLHGISPLVPRIPTSELLIREIGKLINPDPQ